MSSTRFWRESWGDFSVDFPKCTSDLSESTIQPFRQLTVQLSCTIEMSPPRLRNTSPLIAALPPPLLSTIFSFADIPTDLGIFCRVCKQWRDSCHSPLAFAGQRLIIDAQTNPAVVAQWASCFTTVRMLQLTGENLTEELLGSLKPHVSHVPHLRLLWYKQECADDEERICWFTTFAQTFCNLSRLDIRCDLTPKDEQRLLSCFVGHFPRLQRFKYFSHPQHGQNSTADTPNLIKMLPSLTRLTHLHFYSHSLLPQICDDVMLAIAEHCPLLTNLHLVRPAADINMPLTEAGVIALASGCPHLTTYHLEDFSTTFRCYFPSSLLDTLLTHSFLSRTFTCQVHSLILFFQWTTSTAFWPSMPMSHVLLQAPAYVAIVCTTPHIFAASHCRTQIS